MCCSADGFELCVLVYATYMGSIDGHGGGCVGCTVGCPSTGGCWKLEIMHFNGYYAHVRISLDELSAKLKKFGSHIPLLPIYT